MASKAIYSEIVELVLNIDKYQTGIDDAAKTLSTLKAKIEESKNWQITLATGSYTKSIDDAIRLEQRLASEIQRSNQLYRERVSIANARDNAARIELYRGRSDVGNFLGNQSRARDSMSGRDVIGRDNAANAAQLSMVRTDNERREATELDAIRDKAYADLKEDLTRQEKISNINVANERELGLRRELLAKATEAELNAIRDKAYADLKNDLQRRSNMAASTALNKEQNDAALAGALRERRRLGEQAADAEARHQRKTMDSEATRRKDTDNFFNKQAQSLSYLANFEKSEALNRRIEYQQMLALDNQRLQLAKARVAAETKAVQGTMGYKVGSIASGARVGAGLDIAAGAAFGLGATNLGGMIYMMERFSYASGIGQKNLGELLQKLGLVKLTGEGAAASMQLLGNNIMKLGGAVAALAAPIGAMFAGNKLDNAIAKMSTLLADTTVKGEAFNKMMNSAAASAARVSESFGIDIVEVVNGFKDALSTGIEAADLEKFSTSAATVAKGLGTSFGDSVSILTTLKDAYKGTVGDMTTYSDALFNAINVGKFQVDDLRANLGRVAVTAGEAGVSLNDTLTYLSLFTRAGLSTSQSITSLNRMIVDIVNPTDKAKKQYEALGIQFGAAAFKGRTLIQVMDDIKARTGGNIELIGELFPQEQGRRGAAISTSLSGLAKELAPEVAKTGTAIEAANRAMDTFSQNFGKIGSAIWNVVELIGRDLLQVANDVFFPGGAMGADTLTNLKNILEVIGIVVKEVGIILITAFGTAYHVIKAIGMTITGITNMLTGEFRKGLLEIKDGLINGAVGVASGITAMVTTVGDSAKRMLSNVTGVVGDTAKKVDEAVDDTAAKVKGVYGEDAVTQMEQFGNKTVSMWDKIIAQIEKARFESTKLAWEQANPIKPVTPVYNKPISETEQAFLNKVGIGSGIRTAAANESQATRLWKYGPVMQEKRMNESVIARIKAAGGLDPEDPDVKAQLEAWQKGWTSAAIQAAEKLGEEEAKARIESYRKAMIAAGFGHLLPAETTGTKAAPKSLLDGMDILMKGLRSITEGKSAFGSTSTTTRSGYIFNRGSSTVDSAGTGVVAVTSTSAVDMSPEEQLRQARNALAMMKAYYQWNKIGMIASDRKAHEEQLKIAEAEIEKLTKKQAKATAEKYKDEYENAKKLYDIKMSYFDKEGKRIDALLEKYSDFFKTLDQRRVDREFSRMDPMRAYRQQREGIETGIENLRNVKDPADALKASEALLKRIDAFMSQGEKVGEGRRSSMFADEFEAKIAEIMKGREGGLKQEKVSNENNIDNAVAKFKSDMASNPVAQAALAQAMVVVKEAVGKAAENGIGVSGDLVQSINISDIDVNIPVDKFKTMVRDLARTVFADMYRDAGSGNRSKGIDNIEPVGAP